MKYLPVAPNSPVDGAGAGAVDPNNPVVDGAGANHEKQNTC